MVWIEFYKGIGLSKTFVQTSPNIVWYPNELFG